MIQEIGQCCCVQEAAGLDLQPQVSEQKRLTPAKPIDMNYKRGIRSQIKTRVENRGEESRNYRTNTFPLNVFVYNAES